ncbi:MAG: protoheme IX farnesyltransferase [Chthonomonas sp.]|nr:protoheme IX farnesyltransferase [Chthonomonas sp.]
MRPGDPSDKPQGTQSVLANEGRNPQNIDGKVQIPLWFRRLTIFNVCFTVLVILWGAVVRATGSGAGCGDHWPKCDGEIIPTALGGAKAIEFTHRAMTGLWLIPVFFVAIWVLRNLPKESVVRKAALISAGLGIIESLIGAWLVLGKLVGQDLSVTRAVVMALHHFNTTCLLAVITLTAYFTWGGERVRLKGQGAVLGALGVGAFAMVGTIVSGAITALGDTLFKPTDTFAGLARTMDPAAHFLERLRIAHPVISTSATLYLLLGLAFVGTLRKSPQVNSLTRWTTTLLVLQLGHGALNVALKAPVYFQIMHLLIADAIWILFVLLCAQALSVKIAPVIAEGDEEPYTIYSMPWKEKINAFVVLTKPRVISLLLFTTVLAMFIAARGWPGGWLLVWVTIGGYFAAGSANAINMVIDSDIDGRMARTSHRPTVAHVMPLWMASAFAIALAVLSFAILGMSANVLTAVLAMAGLLFYVVIYTILLKRRTWHNIVIGGAAGAFPPLVGWAAVTNSLSPLAWFLFALIVVWTPVHFWALALFIKDEYREANIPMLPVVKGDHATVVQITAYSILTTILCAFPLVLGEAGLIYTISAVLLNGVLVLRSWQLMQSPDRPKAVRLFKFSMVYLALIFVMMAIDQAGGGARLSL